MKKAERILGIVTIALFSLGLLFKYQRYPGGSLLISACLPAFILGYLPLHYINQRKMATSFPERLFLVLKFISYSLVMAAIVMMIMHWPGGQFIMAIGTGLVFCLMLTYFFLRYKGSRRQPSGLNELVIAVLIFGVFIYINNPRAPKTMLEGHKLVLDQYEKQNAGIESSNRMIYESIDSINLVKDPALIEGIQQIRLGSEKIHHLYDSIKQEFIHYCNLNAGMAQEGLDNALHPSVLSSGHYGTEFFIVQKQGLELKAALEEYMVRVREIVDAYYLPAGLIGLGLDVEDIEDAYGTSRSWEVFMFEDQRVSSVYNNLLRIKQMILQTESAVLNGLINQADLSQETKILQDLAAKESEKAMDLKENEIVRIRQQQELQSLQLEQSQTVLQQRKVMIISAFGGIALVLILLVMSTRAFYLKRKDNKRLAKQKKEITGMNEALNERNGEISSSIEYAKRLQTSILPSPGLLNTRIKDHFVLFMPKQRVSGDFYWWTQIEDHVVITAVDCTGHGVPGAFMSMLGVSMLREIVSKEYVSHPGVILRRLRKEVMYALKQTGEFGEQKDGMDMALVSINMENLECQFAGANNPLYLVRNGELTEFKGDRMPIAIHQNMDKFKMHEIQLQPGDHLYLFSDGYVDQFGGPDDKKFKFKAFRQMLVDNATQPMKKQKQILERTISEWKGDRDQVDDIVVLGLEI
jgi:serine phosphatase RsbU (regulator of sigma subunit)